MVAVCGVDRCCFVNWRLMRNTVLKLERRKRLLVLVVVLSNIPPIGWALTNTHTDTFAKQDRRVILI